MNAEKSGEASKRVVILVKVSCGFCRSQGEAEAGSTVSCGKCGRTLHATKNKGPSQ